MTGSPVCELRLGHLDVEVVALARALADAGEARHAAVRLRDVVDELHDEDRLADAGAAEEADLAALAVGGEQVDDLDARLEDLDLRRLLDELRRARGGWACASWSCTGGPSSTGSPMTLRMRPEALGADGHRDGAAGVADGHAADQAVGRVHGDGADGVLAEVLRDLEGEVVLGARDAGVRQLEGVQDLGQLAVGELDVDDGADDLDDLAVSGRGAVRAEGERGLGHGAFHVGPAPA